MTKRELIWSAVRFDPDRLRPGTATRCTIGFGVPILVTSAMGHPAWGVLASLGALYAGMASFTGTYPARFRLMAGTTLVMGFVTWLAGAVCGQAALASAAVGVVSLILALYASKSPGANTIAVQGTGVMVVISLLPATAANPVGNAMLVLLGGIFQTLLLAVVWPFQPLKPEQAAVARVYGSLAAFVRSLPTGGAGEIPDARPFAEAWGLLDEPSGAGRERERLLLWHALRGGEALRAALVPFGREATECENPAEVSELCMRVEQELMRIASAMEDSSAHFPKFEDFRPDPTTGMGQRALLIRRIFIELQEPPSPADAATVKAPSLGARLWAALRPPESLALRSLSVQHAIRYALAVGLTVAASHHVGSGHAYWIPLTVALVLRADYATTLTVGIGRISGTVAGVVLASLLTSAVHPSPSLLGILMLISGWAACALFQGGYAAFTVAITSYVVFSVAATGVPERAAAMERLVSTLVGIVVAVVTNLVWPIWQSRKVRNVLHDALQAQIAFGREIERRLTGDGNLDPEELRIQARALRVEAERVVQAAEVEPRWGRVHVPESAHQILAGIDENAAELLTLYAENRHGKGPASTELSHALERAARMKAALEA